MIRVSLVCLVVTLLLGTLVRAENPPISSDPRIKIELFTENPQIVTPTGVDVDEFGRVWAIESNTHFPPEGYQGHSSDRVLVFTDEDADGKAGDPTIFVDGLRHAMSIAVRPAWMSPIVLPQNETAAIPNPTQIFVATRRDLKLIEDTNGDGKADCETVLLQLDTKGDYPHN